MLENLSADDLKIHEDDNKLVICSQQRIFIKGKSRNFIADDIEFNFATEESIKQCIMTEFAATTYLRLEPYIQTSKNMISTLRWVVLKYMGGVVQEIYIQKGEIVNEIAEEINRNFRDFTDEKVREEYTISPEENLDWEPTVLIDGEKDDFNDIPF